MKKIILWTICGLVSILIIGSHPDIIVGIFVGLCLAVAYSNHKDFVKSSEWRTRKY